MPSNQNHWIGKPVLRKEGPSKVTGAAQYIDDLKFEGQLDGMLHGVTVRSTVPRGRIRGIRFEPGVPWDQITVVTAKDIPGKNAVALILYDQPFLADGQVNHPEEPILLLAHPDRYLLEEARKRVHIEMEELPAVLTMDQALKKDVIVWGSDNILKSYHMVKGDVDSVWSQAAHIVEGTYETGAQEQLYIEPNGVVAVANSQDGVTVWGSLQCPYYVHKALLPLFGLPPEKIRVIQAETGGGFGGKEEYPSMLSGHAALLAWKTGKPVKMIYDRAEDMVATTKRHPSRTRHKTAVSKDGKLLAMDIEFTLDGGAYATLSAVVLSRGTIHAAGPYSCPNVRIRSQAVATNSPPHGAFRGFGAPQSIFGLERHLDQVAKVVGLEPDELRRINFIQEGQTTATGQVIQEKIRLAALMDQALKDSDYHAKRARFEEWNARPAQKVKKGIGFATFMHGSGFTGSGERTLASVVGVEGTDRGTLRVLAASTEIGQGTNTVFAQVVGEALGLHVDAIEVHQPDTKYVPNSGPTVASRTVMVVGKLVEKASLGLRDTLLKGGFISDGYDTEQFMAGVKKYVKEVGPLKSLSQYQQPGNIFWDDEKYQGDAYGAYAWAAYVAEVEVDCVTYQTKVVDFVARQEIGRVVHPVLAAGQIEGGVAQAIGYALYEKVLWDKGRMINGQMTNYIMPTSVDLPPIRVFFEELPYAHGPGGAKGIGELPMDGPAPAILNAVQQAVGRSVTSIPMLPEDLFTCLKT